MCPQDLIHFCFPNGYKGFLWQRLGAEGFESKKDKIAVLWYSEFRRGTRHHLEKGYRCMELSLNTGLSLHIII